MKSAPGTIDLTDLLYVCRRDDGIDLVLMTELLDCFVTENTRRLREIAGAVRTGNRDALRSRSQTLRASAAMLGAGRLHDLAWHLELDAATDDGAALVTRLASLQHEFEEVVAALRQASDDILRASAE